MNTAKTKAAPQAELSKTVWFAGLVVRTLFIAILVVITARVASPQLEHVWSFWDNAGDLLRVALGAALCIWLLAHIFIVPKDPEAYRTWLYLGLILLPFSALCAIAIW